MDERDDDAEDAYERALRLDELQHRLRLAARDADLTVSLYAEDVTLGLTSLDREYTFCLVPQDWKTPFRHRACLSLDYLSSHALRADDPEALAEDEIHEEVEVQVEYQLLSPGDQVELGDVEATVRPLLEKLNEVLGKTHQVYYTVATDYRGRAHAFEAKVTHLYAMSILDSSFDAGFIAEVARALRAIGP